MIEPVTEQLTMKFSLVQGRRIVCEHCHNPFTYIWGHNESATERVDPEYNSPALRSQLCAEKARDLAKTKCRKKDPIDEALCPHCRCYQTWMIKRSRFTSCAGCCVLFSMIGVGVGIALSFYGVVESTPLAIGVCVLVAVVLGVLLSDKAVLDVGPHDREDPNTKTDEELKALIEQSEGSDPCIAWALQVGLIPENNGDCVFPMGILDSTENSVVPHEYSTAAAEEKEFRPFTKHSSDASVEGR